MQVPPIDLDILNKVNNKFMQEHKEPKVKFHSVNSQLGYTICSDDMNEAQELTTRAQEFISDKSFKSDSGTTQTTQVASVSSDGDFKGETDVKCPKCNKALAIYEKEIQAKNGNKFNVFNLHCLNCKEDVKKNCSDCGKVLYVKNAQNGYFFGCSDYKNCKSSTISIELFTAEDPTGKDSKEPPPGGVVDEVNLDEIDF